jgi:hypothetical protein
MTTPASPAFTGQQVIPYTGNAEGQTINSADSYVGAAAVAGSGAVTVLVNLAQTNQPNAPFQVEYFVDPPGAGGVFSANQFTTDGNGNGATAFTVSGIAPGSHLLAIDINKVPSSGGPGITWYCSGSGPRIPFTC